MVVSCVFFVCDFVCFFCCDGCGVIDVFRGWENNKPMLTGGLCSLAVWGCLRYSDAMVLLCDWCDSIIFYIVLVFVCFVRSDICLWRYFWFGESIARIAGVMSLKFLVFWTNSDRFIWFFYLQKIVCKRIV